MPKPNPPVVVNNPSVRKNSDSSTGNQENLDYDGESECCPTILQFFDPILGFLKSLDCQILNAISVKSTRLILKSLSLRPIYTVILSHVTHFKIEQFQITSDQLKRQFSGHVTNVSNF